MNRLTKMPSLLLIWALLGLQPAWLGAEEGMWIPALLSDMRIAEMQELGLRLSAEDIHRINQGAITEAVVSLGGFCTASVISDKGLIITNHHCGLRTIQRHSTVANNYLENGFWAMSPSEELQNPGLYVRFLRGIRDVTQQVLEGTEPGMPEPERRSLVSRNTGLIRAMVMDTSRYHAEIRSFFYGSEYYLFLYEDFHDVRLVGAPPASIGKFGWDRDNWEWPRHTGDFSLLRIYADSSNQPAAYSSCNVPYRPKTFLKVTTGGYLPGDFTMLLGYPGSTNQYLVSRELEWLLEESLPRKIRARSLRMEVMREYMDSDMEIYLKYASKYSSVSNLQKKWMGQVEAMAENDLIACKKQEEKAFSDWSAREAGLRYSGLVDSISNLTDGMQEMALIREYEREVVRSIEMIDFAAGFTPLLEAWLYKESEPEYFDRILSRQISRAQEFYTDYVPGIDMEIAGSLLAMYYRDISEPYRPGILEEAATMYNGDFNLYARSVFNESMLPSGDQTLGFLEQFDVNSWEMIAKDPFYCLAMEFENLFHSIDSAWFAMNVQKNALYRSYLAGLRKLRQDRGVYPDANRTMRISYGKVEGYRPRDAVRYGYITTLDGVIEKHNRCIPCYEIPEVLEELYEQGDYGPYGLNGRLPVCFIASNHTTNGNSGSPVLNNRGHLIGVNFDRNWEGTLSDYEYIDSQCRNISVDIRYVLFVIDQFAGAGHLLREMEIVDH